MNIQFLQKRRRGSVLGLIAFLLPVLAILAAFAINAAYMQLTRTELMVATDASARAAGRAFSELQDLEQAKLLASLTAAQNTVAGLPLQLDTAPDKDIQFGMSNPQQENAGRFDFTQVSNSSVQNGAASNSVRVVGRRTNGSAGGSIDLLMKGFLGRKTFEPQLSSVAMQVDRDIVLVLDRSGSMAWTQYDWPAGMSPWFLSVIHAGMEQGFIFQQWGNYYYTSGTTPEMYQDWVWEHYYNLGPPPPSPWENLVTAVEVFLDVLKETPQVERVGLVSYATNSTLDLHLTEDLDSILDTLTTLGPWGMTAIGMGMQDGWTVLENPGTSRPFAAKTMVLMTDGVHNQGIGPVTVAQQIAATTNITIHTVTFTSIADQQQMQQVADLGGGLQRHADDGAQLIETFREIANNLPTILVQ